MVFDRQRGRVLKSEVEEFDAKHGKAVSSERYFHYSDGAMRENGPSPAMYEPSKDAHARGLRIVEFWELLLDQAQDSFDRLKQKLASGSPTATDLNRLKELKRRVLAASKSLEEAEADLMKINPQVGRWEQEVTTRGAWLQKYKRELDAFQAGYKPGPPSEEQDAKDQELVDLQNRVAHGYRDLGYAMEQLIACGADLNEEQASLHEEIERHCCEKQMLQRQLADIEV